jgi:nucleotide-binding universal stress UspA family protein
MKRILVPTDFSKNAYHALENAFVLVEREPDAELVLFHNITPFQQLIPSFPDISYFQDYCKLKEQKLRRTIDEVKHDHAEFTQVRTKAVYDIGNTVENIIGYSNNNNIDLIVAANTGNTAIREMSWGSIAVALLGNPDKPVLIFPHKSGIQKMFDTVLLAIDINYPLTDHFVQNFVSVFDQANIKFKIVSIIQNDDELKIPRFESAVRKKLNGYELHFFYIKDEHVARAILQFADDAAVDLICLIGHQRSRFSKLFANSTVNKIAPKVSRPLLILPE